MCEDVSKPISQYEQQNHNLKYLLNEKDLYFFI